MHCPGGKNGGGGWHCGIHAPFYYDALFDISSQTLGLTILIFSGADRDHLILSKLNTACRIWIFKKIIKIKKIIIILIP